MVRKYDLRPIAEKWNNSRRNATFSRTDSFMIIKALSEERGTTGPEKLLDPHVIPEDVGIFDAIDEDGNDLVSK